ncbi:hypothetical protein C8Q79DRAFT_977107 [Trametes meyenii]|nr:hypothetical protein C8Q79DRAFT_977107 [Trametes meyenii]
MKELAPTPSSQDASLGCLKGSCTVNSPECAHPCSSGSSCAAAKRNRQGCMHAECAIQYPMARNGQLQRDQ